MPKSSDPPLPIAGGGLVAVARVYGEFYHARGVTAELRNIMLSGRTPEQSMEGIAWLYGGA